MAGGAGLYRVDSSDGGTGKTVSGTPAKDNGTSTFTVTVGGMAVNEHVGKGCTFATAPNNCYTVVSNTADTVTIQGDASGETADDNVTLQRFQTVQGGIDQLDAEDDGGNFTAEQVIEIFDGTYTEHVAVLGLKPMQWYRLRVRAASGETGVTITSPDDSAYTFNGGVSHLTLSGVTIDHAGGTAKYALYSAARAFVLEDCTILNGADGGIFNGVHGIYARRCVFSGVGSVAAVGWFERCRFSCYRLAAQTYEAPGNVVVACIFDGATFFTRGSPYPVGYCAVLGCTFYNGKIQLLGGEKLTLLDCVVYRDDADSFLHTVCSVGVHADHNTWYTSYATPFKVDGVEKTFAEWQALGCGAHSKYADPLLEDPANGDFTPKKASPATALCPPCGVKYDYNGKPFRLTRRNAGAIETDWTRKFG